MLQICIGSICLVSATPPTVLGQSFWNFTGTLQLSFDFTWEICHLLDITAVAGHLAWLAVLFRIGERKFAQLVQVTWPRWLPCPFMGKTLKNLLLRNQKADDLETCYAASDAQTQSNLFKWWPWIDIDLFYGKVKFGPLCFCMWKR